MGWELYFIVYRLDSIGVMHNKSEKFGDILDLKIRGKEIKIAKDILESFPEGNLNARKGL